MGLVSAVKLWLLIKPIKRIKEFRNKEQKVFKGKLTYASLAIVAAPIFTRLFGFEVLEAELVTMVSGLAVLVGFYGRYRATK